MAQQWLAQPEQAHFTRHRFHVALATGLTMAVLIGAQTVAVLDRSVSARQVTFGNPTVTPPAAAALNGTPTKPGKKPKTTPTPAANAVSADASPVGNPKPSLNISDSSGVQTAPVQPAPFSLSSR